MNDIILSGLLNLFALYNSREGTDRGRSTRMVSAFLSFHFGVKNVEEFLNMYRDLLDLYDNTEESEYLSVIWKLIDNLKGRITIHERLLMVLRIMELVSSCRTTENPEVEFRTLAEGFEINDSAFKDLLAFISDNYVSQNVKILPYGKGSIRILKIQSSDLLLFSVNGDEDIKYNDIPITPESFIIWQGGGVIRGKSIKPLYRYNAQALFETDSTPTQQLKLRGKHINYRFPEGDNGIHDFTFNLYGGELVAIMGGSGTGKTTLLSILNGSIIPQEGEITINGHPISEPAAKALIGYVPQDDLLIEELTVYQNLLYTARLCFDQMSELELKERVTNLLRELGLDAVSHLKVGSPLNKSISGGQRKRLNIALELIREPNVLFLDEPTSGLSSSDTEAVVNLLREQAYKGKLVITIIHQPSSNVFKMFDRLWVLDTGGYPTYDGNPVEAVTYFKKVAQMADAGISVCPTCGNIDSEIILSLMTEKVIDHNGLVTDTRKRSPRDWNAIYQKYAPKAKDKIEDLPPTNQLRPSILKQMWVFLKRNALAKFTDTQWLLITLLEAPVLALICASLTHYAPLEGYSIMENKNLVSYMFMAIIVATFLGMSGSAEEIFKDKALLKREKFLNLSYASYIFSKIIFMAGVALVQTLLFILVGNTIMGIGCLFTEWWLILFITALLASLTGLLLSQWLKSIVSIYITIPILLIPQILLCGLVVNFPDLTPKSHTANVPVIGDLIPSRWSFEALAVTSYTDNDFERNFFDIDRQRYMAMYYERVFLLEMRSQSEMMNEKLKNGHPADDNMTVLKTSMPILMDVCGLDAYEGDWSYQSLSDTFSRAEEILRTVMRLSGNELEARTDTLIKKYGNEGVIKLKKDNYNMQLEKYVVNVDTQKRSVLVDGHIVPRYGYVFIDPLSRNGRAPFFSCVKILGNTRFTTLEFNLYIMLLMCMLCTVVLVMDLPSKFQKINKYGK